MRSRRTGRSLAAGPKGSQLTGTSDNVLLEDLHAQLCVHLSEVYKDHDQAALADRLIEALAPEQSSAPRPPRTKCDQDDVFLITYGNSIEREGEWPLATLDRFVDEHLQDTISGLHLLPFFPYSSDDGFAVINYLQVNDALGDWDDVGRIAAKYRLMADLVINHASSRSQWFENFRKGIEPGRDYFISCEEGT
ncbi:MAG: alpha-amylase, partial [Gammaproteobacteria bacterium]|nr:alpha-amylase [Gammaproteobacteria bacterium]